MTTVRILVKKALQKAKVITKDDAPSADEITDGRDSLNAMSSLWSTDSLLCTAYSLESFTLSSAAEYTIGTGQTLNTGRPTQIITAVVRQGITDYPLQIISPEKFEKYIADKETSGLPEFLTYDNGFPTGKIRLFPKPQAGYTLRLQMEKPLQTFGLDDEVSLPPGWEHTIIYNLAEVLRPEYGIEPDPMVTQMANASKAAIARATARARPLDSKPLHSLGSDNIYTGYWR